jgi:hypothetical protein
MLMAFLSESFQNNGMPSRQISPQSFDDILSELGDDPAIPDPHGIRKPNRPKTPVFSAPNTPESQPKITGLNQILQLGDLKKCGVFLGLAIGFIGVVIAGFMVYEHLNSDQQTKQENLDSAISELKKELSILREEVLEIEDSLYESIELIEVSIHSIKENRPSIANKPRPQAIPFESELRRWRYLGVSQIGGSQRTFFHNGKVTVMFEKGSHLLGDWKLSNADKDAATLTHPQGKSLTFKPSKTE